MFLAPDRGLTVIHFPIAGIISVVSDIATERDKVRVSVGNGLDQLAARFRIGRVGVTWICETRVPIGDEVDPVAPVELDVNRVRLRCKGNPGKKTHKQEKQILPLLAHGPIPYMLFVNALL